MAAIGTAASDITYVPLQRFVTAPGRTRRMVNLQFPMGANVTYTAGGIPLDKGMLGVPHVCQRIAFVARLGLLAANNRYEWNGDSINPKLIMITGSTDAEFSGSVPAGQSIVIDVEGS